MSKKFFEYFYLLEDFDCPPRPLLFIILSLNFVLLFFLGSDILNLVSSPEFLIKPSYTVLLGNLLAFILFLIILVFFLALAAREIET